MVFLNVCLAGLVFGLTYSAEDGSDFMWGYHGASAPKYWANHFAGCAGDKQSPIDIPYSVTKNLSLGTFTFSGYDNMAALGLTLLNNGHAAQISIATPGAAYISGGGLDGNYTAAQLHFHWGVNSSRGGEHTFRKIQYPLELHIVHYKTEYESLASAVEYADGLAVLGFWFGISDDDNENLDNLIDGLKAIKHKGDSTPYTGTSFLPLMPSDHERFYRYQGSLTTPTCNEAVIWSVFEDKNTISEAQMAFFRGLYENEGGETNVHLVDNYRPVQELNSRTVYQNFEDADFHWGYEGFEAPQYWPGYFETCAGDEQSPIDLVDEEAVFKEYFGFLKFKNYNNNMTMSLTNNGHTIQLNIESEHLLREGGLPSTYKAVQLHLHWGASNGMGSEHTRNGKSSPMEIHVVHYNTRYSNFANATMYRDGLAVLGAFFQIQGNDNPKLAPLIAKLPDVKYKGANVRVSGFSINDLIFDDLDIHPFFRYDGSLTTPTCSEIVIWTVLMGRVPISEAQLAEFRKVIGDTESAVDPDHPHYIVNNYRPVQRLNSRKVYINMPIVTAGSGVLSGSLFSSFVLAIIAALSQH